MVDADKRFKFIRGNVFDGLGDFLESPVIPVKNKNISYYIPPEQLVIPIIDKGSKLKAKLGRYFEVLSQGIYGGDSKERYELSEDDSDENYVSEPDITHANRNLVREVKAVCTGLDLKLLDNQINKYIKLKLSEELDGNPEIRFDVFRHKAKNLLSEYKLEALEVLADKLTKNVRFMVSFPFTVAYAIFMNKPGNSKLTSRYEGGYFATLTRLNSSGLNGLLASPEKTLRKLGLNDSDYFFIKGRFPNDVKVNNKFVNPFPVLKIYERNPKKSLELFKEKIKNIHQPVDYFWSDLFSSIGEEVPREFIEEQDYDPRQDGCSDAEKLEDIVSIGLDGDVPF